MKGKKHKERLNNREGIWQNSYNEREWSMKNNWRGKEWRINGY